MFLNMLKNSHPEIRNKIKVFDASKNMNIRKIILI